jgi:hypothetical protein
MPPSTTQFLHKGKSLSPSSSSMSLDLDIWLLTPYEVQNSKLFHQQTQQEGAYQEN